MHAFISQDSGFKVQGSIDTLEINPDTSIGIEEVRQIQHFLSRKPIQSDQNIVVIHQAHLLTVPAQNALLKTLEEPPGNSLIYLVTDFPDQLLPTVLSRIQLEPSTYHLEPKPKDLEKARKLLEKLLSAKIGERLPIIEAEAFTRETALDFLNNLEHILHNQLYSSTYNLEPSTYNLICETRKYLKANCNVKLCLDNFALNTPPFHSSPNLGEEKKVE